MIRLVQCLCPQRHAILAFAYKPGTKSQKALGEGGDAVIITEANAAEYLRLVVTHLIEKKRIDPWCGICRSTVFTYDDQPTRFKTMAEARPELERLERAQAATAQMMRNRN